MVFSLGLRDSGSGFRVRKSRLTVWGSGPRVEGSGFEILGSESLAFIDANIEDGLIPTLLTLNPTRCTANLALNKDGLTPTLFTLNPTHCTASLALYHNPELRILTSKPLHCPCWLPRRRWPKI